MVDNFLAPRRSKNLHPSVGAITSKIVAVDHSKDTKEPFRTPSEVAAGEERPDGPGTAGPSQPAGSGTPPPAQPPSKKRSFKEWRSRFNTKQKILLTGLAAVLLSGLVLGTYFLFFTNTPAPPAVVHKVPPPKPKLTTVPSNLTGLPVKPAVNDRPVTAIMIENSMDARPQSGIGKAGVVFEAIAEGGITRFLTLFQDTEPTYIGPVRSVRPYYLSWLLGFDGAVAHAGGSAEALSLINAWRVKDLNHHASYFWRVNTRFAPHNLYTSLPKLRQYEAQKGFGKAHFTPLARKEKEEPLAKAKVRVINFNISSFNYNSRFVYQKKTNSYIRFQAGVPHTDERSRQQLAPKVVVALILPQGKNGIYTTYKTIGSGKVFIFQDGKVVTGLWKKANNTSNYKFVNGTTGAEIKLNPGQTWFTALSGSDRLKYTP